MADDDLPDLNDIETPFDRRVKEIIDADTTPFELVASLTDRDLPVSEPGSESRSPFPFTGLVRIQLFHKISGIPVDTILERLKENSDEAAAFGFEDIPDKYGAGTVPDQSRLSKAWNGDRFGSDEREWVKRRADRILTLVHEQGNPMGLQSLESEDKRDASQTTKTRHKKEKRNDAAKDAAKMAAAVYEFGRETNTSHDMERFLQVLAEMSADDKTAHAACKRDDDPLAGENLKPDGDTFRYHPNNLEPVNLIEMHDRVSELLIEQIKKYIEFDRPTKVGIDSTEIEIPGDPEKTEPAIEVVGELFDELEDDAKGQFVHGVQDEDSDAKCYKFITLNVVGQHFRIPLVVRPVPKGMPRARLVRELYWRARELVGVEEVFLDAEFFGADSLRSLNETGAEYVMSAPKDKRLKRWLETTKHDVAVKQDHSVFGPVEGVGREYVKTNIVAKPSIQNPDKTVLFATSKDVRDEIGLDRRRTMEKVNEYNHRGHHEKCYEMVKEFLAPTESKQFRLHLFYFCFATLAYGMWKLADFRVKKDVGIPLVDEEGETTDTVVSFDEFLITVEEFLVEPG